MSHTCWGGHVEGIQGYVSAPIPRALALAVVTLWVAMLGFATPGLLDILAGSWVSVLVFRRRMLCLLDLIFNAMRGHSVSTLLRLSRELRSELFMLALLAPLATSDLRCPVSDIIYVVDASSRKTAVCFAQFPVAVARELYRHVDHKGKWTRLLDRSSAWLKTHSLLDPELEFPGDQAVSQSEL